MALPEANDVILYKKFILKAEICFVEHFYPAAFKFLTNEKTKSKSHTDKTQCFTKILESL